MKIFVPAIMDGEPGSYGIVFPGCDGSAAMGDTISKAIENASAVLLEVNLKQLIDLSFGDPRDFVLREGEVVVMVPVIWEFAK